MMGNNAVSVSIESWQLPPITSTDRLHEQQTEPFHLMAP